MNADGKTWKWTVTGNEGNCYTVVTANSKIDGFFIIGGNANLNKGGGVNSISEVNNCTVSNCYALYTGGGISSSSSVNNCYVSNCSANSGGGISISNSSVSNCSVNNCNVSNCNAGNGGGIFTSSNLYSTISNCAVSNCSASSAGGGIYSSTSVTNCAVSNCTANSGGGIYSSSSISNCIVSNCLSDSGGGIYSNLATNCTVFNCSATNGGGIYSNSSVTNCTVYNCTATNGGGIYSNFSSVTNCTVSNSSATNGGGIYSKTPSTGTNCAFSNNSTNGAIGSGISGGVQCISPNVIVAYIQPTSFIGIATNDAQKLELKNASWHLKVGSPCINAGTSTNLSTTILTGKDLDNSPRVLYGTIDIGAYEYVVPTISMTVMENFNNWTDFDKSNVFFRSAKLNTLNDIKWTIVNQKADFSWQTNLTSTYSQPIFTYQIDGTKSSKVYLRYDMFFQAYAGTISPLGTEKLNIEFSTDLVTWSSIATYSNANGTIANQTYKHDISTLAAGKTFFIRFNANGVNSNRIEKWEIDNVIIDANGLSAVNNVQEDKYKYSVNNGVLNIANLGQVSFIQLFDINGKLLSAKNTDSQIFLFALPAHGVYVVKVTSDSDIENKKIVW